MSGLEEAIRRMSSNLKSRPITTLFMLTSVDGKISTGSSVDRDFDTDLLMFDETKAGIKQYYDAEQETDLWTMCTGKTKAKIGVNAPNDDIVKVSASIAIIDNSHLNTIGVSNLLKQYKRVVVFTKNNRHPALSFREENLSVHLSDSIDFVDILNILYRSYGCERLTIQTGSETNSEFIRKHLVDYIHFFISPVIVGGNDTPSVVGGESLESVNDLRKLALLELDSCVVMDNSYISVKYKVKNSR